MARRKFKDTIRFTDGYILERPTIDEPTDHAAEGSRNVLFTGQAEPEPFKGLVLVSGIGGIHYSGLAGFTSVTPGFSIDDIPWEYNICPASSHLDISAFTDGEALITNVDESESEDVHTISPIVITTDGYVEWRFAKDPAVDGASCVVSLRYAPVSDCALIQSGVDRGFECYLDASPNIVHFGSRDIGGAWSQVYSGALSNVDDVFRMQLVSGECRLFINGELEATANDVANGDDLALFVRVDGQSFPSVTHGQVALKVLTNGT